MIEHYVSARLSERIFCGMCRHLTAAHKIAEEIPDDEPGPQRHPFTQYVCCACFKKIMGNAVFCNVANLTEQLSPG